MDALDEIQESVVVKNGNSNTHSSLFSDLRPLGPEGPFSLETQFIADSDSCKVNLIIGAYRNNQGQAWQPPSLVEAKKRIHVESCLHEYLPLHGSAEFLESSKLLVLGPEITNQAYDRIASIQTISGTGANSLIAKFLDNHTHPANIWLPDPTWVNHADIWKENAPGVDLRWYPYYDESSRSLSFSAMIQTLQRDTQENDAILLHACAHNPTGLDPTKEQWEEIALVCKEKKLFVIFDSAYQGFASGDLDHDAWAIRHFFTHPGLEFAICQSFSKNMSLYGERLGALHIVVSRKSSSPPTASVHGHLAEIQRACVSMAPLFGSRVANEIFKSEDLHLMWQADLLLMSNRIKTMRKAVYDELVRLQTPGNWDHVVHQTGMFSYTGLTEEQVGRLRKEHHVYMLPSGRASICGLTCANFKYTAQAIHSVITDTQKRQV
ncbi:Aspartate aminotransferase [Penicillium atrosanguineum]|uniref:Aspartate aminotransferase n=1 Tax=Penicillium atrosanguineum TaxID=1132637 RepID=A0A9W9QAS6_9EURO|nr:Aspartate aminotransferase [Penicillium atrosanguineum]